MAVLPRPDRFCVRRSGRAHRPDSRRQPFPHALRSPPPHVYVPGQRLRRRRTCVWIRSACLAPAARPPDQPGRWASSDPAARPPGPARLRRAGGPCGRLCGRRSRRQHANAPVLELRGPSLRPTIRQTPVRSRRRGGNRRLSRGGSHRPSPCLGHRHTQPALARDRTAHGLSTYRSARRSSRRGGHTSPRSGRHPGPAATDICSNPARSACSSSSSSSPRSP